MTGVDLVVFDLDGTLVDSSRDLAAAVNHARRELGLEEHDLAAVTSFVGDGVDALIDRAFRGCSDVDRARARRAFGDHYAAHSSDRTRVFPGIPELLDALADRRLAVVTNKAEPFVAPLLDRVGLAGRFDLVVGERPGVPRKPAPDMVRRVLDELGVPADRAILVGDGAQDLGAGRAAGLRVVRVTWGYGDVPDVDADLVIDHPSHLADALA